MCRQLQPKKDLGNIVLSVYIAAKKVLPTLHYLQDETHSFKSGCDVRVENG